MESWMANLIDIQSQIEALKKQAEQIRSKDFDVTLADIRKTMAAYGITVKDLLAAEKKRPGKAKAVKAASANSPKAPKAAKGPKTASTVAAKFKGPNGESWSGRGLTPKWLTALVSQGRSKEEFAVVTTAPEVIAG
jgi:DNA-binding protein H-NS